MAHHPRLVLFAALIAYLHCAAASRDLQLLIPERRALLQQQCDPISFGRLMPSITRAPVIDLQWLDKNDQVVLAITKKQGLDAGGLWWSKNSGKDWVEKTSLLNANLPAGEPVDVLTVMTQKSNPLNLVLFGTGSYFWTSTDMGVTFTAHQTPTKWRGSGIKAVKPHPRQENWLLVLVKRPDCKAVDHALTECPHDLMLTQDLFSGNPTWRNLTADAAGKIAGFVDFDWGAALCPKGNCNDLVMTKDEMVLATMYARPGDYDQPWDPDVHFVTSDDWFDSFQTHVRCGNMFEIVGRTVYLAIANSCPTDITGQAKHEGSSFPQGITLYTSEDAGCSFTQACLPVAVKQEGYELMETHDGTGTIIIVDFLINNGIFDIPASSVYTAGPHHALFSLSLTDVYRTDYGMSTDFAKIEGLPGVYIANQMVARPDPTGSTPGMDDYYDLSDTTGEPMVETRITFNGGGRWQKLPAPPSFNNPKCNRCDGSAECYLHLHGMSSWDSMGIAMPAVYSNPSAPGFIMASGNVGAPGVGLDDNDGLCTWLSTDGGVTWSDVAVGSYIYEYADWGGIIVMARHPGANDKPAEEVLFSTDYGRCWQHVPLAEALLVDNIRIEPDGQRPRVVLHGRRCRQSLSQLCGYSEDDRKTGVVEGIMYLVDVQELMGTRLGLCGAVDHEMWGIPADARGGQVRCVLGRQTQIERRKPFAACFNGPDYKRPSPTNTTCPCSAEADTECDYGYLKSGTDCLKIPFDRMPFCPAINQNHYTVSSTGKRQVHADSCSGMASVIPDLDTTWKGPTPDGTCVGGPGRGGSKRRSGWFGFLMFLLASVVTVGGFIGWWIYLATESQRDAIRDVVAGGAAGAKSVVAWLRAKITGRSAQYDSDGLGYFQPLGDMGDGHSDNDPHRSLFTLK